MNAPEPVSKLEPTPLVWLILGDRMGDNAQVLALGKKLGWPFVTKQMVWDHECDIQPRDQGISLIGVDIAHSDQLAPPWPDIIVAVGQRSVPVSRWIAKQSGGRTMNIRLGRPRIEFAAFDLIVTTPQYGLPSAPNLRELLLPIALRDDDRIAAAVARWQPALSQLPRPWTAVLVGGETQKLRLSGMVAKNLVASLNAYRRANGGTLLVTTSPRTPEDVSDALAQSLDGPNFMFRWQAGAENPYLAFLALADAIVITNDSISMIAESANFAKPIYLYELPAKRPTRPHSIAAYCFRLLLNRRQRRLAQSQPADILDMLFDFLTRHGKIRPRRNTLPLQRRLYESGVVRPFTADKSEAGWKPQPLIEDSVNKVVEEIHRMWRQRVAQHAGMR
jgi:mitochondrial fission protein ELM1